MAIWMKLAGAVLWCAGLAGTFMAVWLWGATANPYEPGTIEWAQIEIEARETAVYAVLLYLGVTVLVAWGVQTEQQIRRTRQHRIQAARDLGWTHLPYRWFLPERQSRLGHTTWESGKLPETPGEHHAHAPD